MRHGRPQAAPTQTVRPSACPEPPGQLHPQAEAVGEGEEIAGVQEAVYGIGDISPFPKLLGLCIIGLILRVVVEIQTGLVKLLKIEFLELFLHS